MIKTGCGEERKRRGGGGDEEQKGEGIGRGYE